MKWAVYLVIFLLWSVAVKADADGPDFYQIAGKGSVQMFADKAVNSQLLLLIPQGTNGLQNLGCSGGPSFSDWQAMDDQQRLADKQKAWCKISVNGRQGWVLRQHLSEGSVISEKPTFDCTAARPHEIEILICGNNELIALDLKMAQVYKAATAAASALDIDAVSAKKALQQSQNGWIKGRNECWKAVHDKAACTIDAYKQRITKLQIQWLLIAETNVAVYTCSDNYEDELSARFFIDTEMPGALIDYGDRNEVFIQQRAASGARYVGDYGKVFWVKGQQANFTWQQSNIDKTCVIVN